MPARLSILIPTLLLFFTAAHAEISKKPESSKQASATPPTEHLGSVESWMAYAYKDKSGKVCYIAGEAQKSEPSIGKRKHPLAMVTHRPSEKVANVVSFVEGHPLKEGSDVAVDIGGAKFELFTKGDGAWARTPELDKAIVGAMAKGKLAVVKSTPKKGLSITDTYSLAGFAQALALIDKACDVKR